MVEEAPVEEVAEVEPADEMLLEEPEEGLEDEEDSEEVLTAARYKLQGTKVIGTIDLSTVEENKPTRSRRRRKRKRKAAKPKGEAVAVERSSKLEKR